MTCSKENCRVCAGLECRACENWTGASVDKRCDHDPIEKHFGTPAIGRTGTPTTPLAEPLVVEEVIFTDPEAMAALFERIAAIIRKRGKITIT